MDSIEHQYILLNKAQHLKDQLDSGLAAIANSADYIKPVDERDKQNLLIAQYHMKEVSLYLHKILSSSTPSKNVTTNANVFFLDNFCSESRNWIDVTPEGSVNHDVVDVCDTGHCIDICNDDIIHNNTHANTHNNTCDNTHNNTCDNTCVDNDISADVFFEHDIILNVNTHLELINNDMFLKEIKNIDTVKNIKFYMERGVNKQSKLYIYKYNNDDTEYYIGDNNCIYKITEDSVLEVHDMYTSVQQPQNKKQTNSKPDGRYDNKRNKNNKKKYIEFIMMDYFVCRNIDEVDGHSNYARYKDVKFICVPDKYNSSCRSNPFVLWNTYLVGENKRLYAIDKETNNILDNHNGPKYWRESKKNE